MVVKEFLDSDRVNFLVWRYLLEGNYRETAAKFQKEWHIREPHQHFTFAPHVKSHALVSVINRGLLYHALERQKGSGSDGAAAAGIFGPLVVQPPAKVQEDGVTSNHAATTTTSVPPAPAAAAAQAPAPAAAPPVSVQTSAPPAPPPLPILVSSVDDADQSRKRPQQQLPNGSPVKRPRLSNGGYENGTEPAAGVTTPMDVDSNDQQQQEQEQEQEQDRDQMRHQDQDQNHDNHAYPSPLEGEDATTPVVHTEGPERGTQLDKVEELTPYTTFIRFSEDAGTDGDARPSPSPTAEDGADVAIAPTLLHCQWNPRDPSVLAASGTGALARIWSVSRVAATETEPAHDHVSPNGLPLLEPETSPTTVVSQLAWTSDGTSLAAVSESGGLASINVYGLDGSQLQSFDSPSEQVIKLSWNPSNTALLAITPSPDESGALVTVYQMSGGPALSYTFAGHDMNAAPLDASWTSDAEFLVCGGDLLASLYCAESSIVQVRKFETRQDDNFRNVLFDWRSKLAATSSEKGVLDLWDESGQRRSISAHQGAITTMEWQPLPPSHPQADDERLIATGGEDCAILIWNARTPESKPRSFLTMDSPIVSLAFTPDGAFIAGATATQVLIWKVGNPIVPRAVWKRQSHPGWLSPRANSESEEEGYAEHCLGWDASGQKLAYGSNSRLAVINWSR